MATFDNWEAVAHPPEDYLMHFRTKGSKNGVRRFQTESGEWTPLGLKERREREGWGDGETKKARKLQKKVEKAERRQEKKAARAERKVERAEIKRKKSLKGLTDEEMKAKLERAKMEAEYRDLTKRGTLIETGGKLITGYLDYKSKKKQQTLEENRQKIEMERLKTQQIQAKEATKKSYNDRKTARSEYKKMKQDVKGGLAAKRKKELKGVELAYRNTTIRGGVSKRINQFLTSGKSEQYQASRKAKGEAKASRIIEKAESRESIEERDRKARKRLGL